MLQTEDAFAQRAVAAPAETVANSMLIEISLQGLVPCRLTHKMFTDRNKSDFDYFFRSRTALLY